MTIRFLILLTLLCSPVFAYSKIGRHIEGKYTDKLRAVNSTPNKNLQYLLSCGEMLSKNSTDGFIGEASIPGVKFINSPSKEGIYIFQGKDIYFVSRKNLKPNTNYGVTGYFGKKKISFELITHKDRFTFADTKYYKDNPAYRNSNPQQSLLPHQIKKVSLTDDVVLSAQTAIMKSIEKRMARIANEIATEGGKDNKARLSDMGPVEYCKGVAQDLGLSDLEKFTQNKLKNGFKYYSTRLPARKEVPGSSAPSSSKSTEK